MNTLNEIWFRADLGDVFNKYISIVVSFQKKIVEGPITTNQVNVYVTF